MNHLDLVLAAQSHREGRALRSASFRHRRLVKRSIALVLWQLGAEPFTAAAIGWGCSPCDLHLRVAGEPRNRQLAFAALLELARWFNPVFEKAGADREMVARGKLAIERATDAPQVMVANRATVTMLERLGRRLAYLPLDGEWAADPALVRFGRHLQFLALHAAVPGQQLVVSMTDLLGDHWVTAQSAAERQSLAALDAFIDPPGRKHGFDAAAEAERASVGPVPEGDEDEHLEPLVSRFNEARAGVTDEASVAPLLRPIRTHFAPLVRRTWDLLWRTRARELTYSEAPSVERRWAEDREAYTRHLDWMANAGRRRTRQTARQAALTLRRLEDAQVVLEAEEACDDPVRMIPYLLDHKAVRGTVRGIDRGHRELATKRMVARPLLTLDSPDVCLMPPGKELYWSEASAGPSWIVHDLRPHGMGTLVVLKLETSTATAEIPDVGAEVCFSIHSARPSYVPVLRQEEPWTHKPQEDRHSGPIESGATGVENGGGA